MLAELVARVHSIEIVEPLDVKRRLGSTALGDGNVEVTIGDGDQGRPTQRRSTASSSPLRPRPSPRPSLTQLKPGARMVIPVGAQHGVQELTLVEKAADGTVHTRAGDTGEFRAADRRGAEAGASRKN